MRFDRRTPLWGVTTVAAFLAAMIWALSPAISGAVEPWDAAAPYYMVALLLCGFLSGLLTGRPLWAHYLGSIAGQFLFGLVVLSFGPLILLGVSFLAVYGLLFIAGAHFGVRRREGMAAQDRKARAPLPAVEPSSNLFIHYQGQSTEELLALQETVGIDTILQLFEEALQQKRALGPLSEEEQYVLAIMALERDLGVGGSAQYLRNASPELNTVVIQALKTIDCPKAAVLCEEIIGTVGAGRSHWQVALELAKPDVQRRLAECDALYRGNDEIILTQLFRWIEEHPPKIGDRPRFSSPTLM